MSGSLNMTLDDMVKRSRNERSRGRGKPRRGRGANGFSSGGRGLRLAHRGPLAVNARPSAFSINKPVRRVRNLPWQNDLFEDSLRAAGVSGVVEVGTRLDITNLDKGVTNQDIRVLFAEMGELKRYAIHFDKFGQPSGSAEVVYLRRSDAFQALKKYNNVLLDGKPMKIEMVGSNAEAPVSARVNVTNVTGLSGRMKRTVVMGQGVVGRGRIRGGPVKRAPMQSQRGVAMRGSAARGRGSRGRGGGGNGGRGKKTVEKSAAELDKDLDNYHAEAMNTS